MELLLERIANVSKTIGGKKREYCIGHLYVDGKYLHDTIEDYDRGLDSETMTLAQIKARKISSRTAIPTGRYRVRLDRVSPKFSQKAYYKKTCGGKVPYVEKVPAYEGILFHCGKNEDSSAGCLIQGKNTVVGMVTESTQCFERLLKVLYSAKDEVWITVRRKYKA